MTELRTAIEAAVEDLALSITQDEYQPEIPEQARTNAVDAVLALFTVERGCSLGHVDCSAVDKPYLYERFVSPWQPSMTEFSAPGQRL